MTTYGSVSDEERALVLVGSLTPLAGFIFPTEMLRKAPSTC